MKNTLIIGASLLLFSLSACGQKSCSESCSKDKKVAQTDVTNSKTEGVVLACKLTTEEQMKRSDELKKTVFKDYEKMNELPEGVEFIYADGKKYSPVLVEFINTERACCPFFTFDLKFLPNSDKVSLTIGGSSKIKEMVKTLISG